MKGEKLLEKVERRLIDMGCWKGETEKGREGAGKGSREAELIQNDWKERDRERKATGKNGEKAKLMNEKPGRREVKRGKLLEGVVGEDKLMKRRLKESEKNSGGTLHGY